MHPTGIGMHSSNDKYFLSLDLLNSMKTFRENSIVAPQNVTHITEIFK